MFNKVLFILSLDRDNYKKCQSNSLQRNIDVLIMRYAKKCFKCRQHLYRHKLTCCSNVASQDVVWLIQISESKCISEQPETDSYGNTIIPGAHYLKGVFFEKLYNQEDHALFKLSKEVTFFYRETIIYPFVYLEGTKKGFKLMNSDYSDIIRYAEMRGL